MDGQLGKQLAVQVDAGLLQTVHELRIVGAVELAGCGNTGNPQAAEISLFLLAADIGIVAGLHDGLFGHLKALALRAEIAFRHLQGLFSYFAGHHSSFYTSHINLPPYHIR